MPKTFCLSKQTLAVTEEDLEEEEELKKRFRQKVVCNLIPREGNGREGNARVLFERISYSFYFSLFTTTFSCLHFSWFLFFVLFSLVMLREILLLSCLLVSVIHILKHSCTRIKTRLESNLKEIDDTTGTCAPGFSWRCVGGEKIKETDRFRQTRENTYPVPFFEMF